MKAIPHRSSIASWLIALCITASMACSAIGQETPGVSMPADRAPVRERPAKTDDGLLVSGPAARAAAPVIADRRLAAFDASALLAEDEILDRTPGTPMRVGIDRALPNGPVSAERDGQWQTLSDGTLVWTCRIEAPTAKGIRLHFSAFDLPDGASLVVAAPTGEDAGVYSGRGPRDAGDFWAQTVVGETVLIEYRDPSGQAPRPTIKVDRLSHVYRGILEPPSNEQRGGDPEPQLLPCQQDVNCHSVDPTARDSVGQMTFQVGSSWYVCSGALLNDVDPNTLAGYFLTANHCLSTQASADTLEIRWFYQTNGCNGTPSSRATTRGARLLATNPATDFTFLRMNDDPRDGQSLAGWTTASPSSTVHGIHHPGGSYKRYSRGVLTASEPICNPDFPLSRYVYNDWTLGITEGGSSGSPLFNTSWQIVGQLYGICYFRLPNCNNPQDYNNMYGRFAVTYPSISSFLNTITPDDAYEPNDTRQQAADFTFGTQNLRLVDFDDYFELELCSNASLSATATFSTSDMDLDLYLLNASGQELDSSEGTGPSETVSANLSAGTYYLRAYKFSGWGGAYTLNVTLNPLTDCNTNRLPDNCDIARGRSPDENGNGVPDECDPSCTRPTITGHPQSITVDEGQSACFTVSATGTPPQAFQWRRNGINLTNGGGISGATAATLCISPVAQEDAGSYSAVVSNCGGNVISQAAALTVRPICVPPSITSHPQPRTITEGQSVAFSVAASGTGPLTFRWRKNGQDLNNGGNVSGVATATLSISPAALTDSGNYDVRVRNACGSPLSQIAALTVRRDCRAPAITLQPIDQTLCTGGRLTLTAQAAGDPAPTYQWRRGGVNLTDGAAVSGATTATLVIDPAAPSHTGQYDVAAENDCGQATSHAATVRVFAGPDCNTNDVPDECETAFGTSQDINSNRIPDECEDDCNSNSIPDDQDIAAGTSEDCNTNAMPDECEPDCNSNGVADTCDIRSLTDSEVWIGLDQSFTIARVDLSGSPIGTFDALQRVDDFEVVDDEIWIGMDGSFTVERVNFNGQPLGNFQSPQRVSDMEVVGNEVWIGLDSSFTIARLDHFGATLNTFTARQKVDDMEVVGNQVWIGMDDDSNESLIIERVDFNGAPLGNFQSPQRVSDMEVVGNEVWIGLDRSLTIGRVDLNGNSIGTFESPQRVSAMELVGNQAWIGMDQSFAVWRLDFNRAALGEFQSAQRVSDFVVIPRPAEISRDCNSNGMPDECEPDCNSNGFNDDCEVVAGTSPDCDTNGVPDGCDIAVGTNADCNSNGIPDECDIGDRSNTVIIPAGEFQMGDSLNEGDGHERPAHVVFVDAVSLSRYEVTNQQYADALNWANGQGLVIVTNGIVYKLGNGTSYPYCATTTSSVQSRITWDGTRFGVVAGKSNHPMAFVTWYGAAAYANWRSAMSGRQPCYDLSTWNCEFSANGYRLPTEAEWEKAARGGLLNRRYPWGDTIDGSMANYGGSGNPFAAGPFPWTTPVGYYDGGQTPSGSDMANGYGLYDMTGNVSEWCNDWYDESYYTVSPYSNPRGPATGRISHVFRGGSWNTVPMDCRTWDRDADPNSAVMGSLLGFRLVRGAGGGEEPDGDCNGNSIPDECELDGDSDGVIDDCDNCQSIPNPSQADCNSDGVGDACDTDCNSNGYDDGCEIAAGTSSDCNSNNLPDGCDIVAETSPDCNSNGVPDECELTSDSLTWHQTTAQADWSGRMAHAALAFNDRMWILGGLGSGEMNDVWSSANGVDWTQVIPNAGWRGRSFHASVIHDGRMWVIGGATPGQLPERRNDVWFSFDGIEWSEATSAAAWSGREQHACVSFAGEIWLLGGFFHMNDVWRSLDGITWTRVLEQAPWAGVQGHSAVTHDDGSGESIWIAGGLDVSGDARNDVWRSSDGTAWTAVTVDAGWPPRRFHTMLAHEGRIWILGGVDEGTGSRRSDVWWSVNGVQWTITEEAADWSARNSHASLIYDGKMWVLGGYDGGGAKNDVWYTDLSRDCNDNGVPDECEVDADTDGVPDECDNCPNDPNPDQTDCNRDGIGNLCGADCNDNGYDDGCEVVAGTSSDCNSNNVPDDCESDADADSDGLPDECDNCPGDFNPDQADCNTDGVGDACDTDCNSNGYDDGCEIAAGTSPDCNSNSLPDGCEANSDCNSNTVPDECDIAAGASNDCDDSGVPDECEADCNSNGLEDQCDIAQGTSCDVDSDGVPDECDNPEIRSVWTGAGGNVNWSTAANWQPAVVPNNGPPAGAACLEPREFLVSIGNSGSFSVTGRPTPTTIESLTIGADPNLTSTLRLDSTLTVNQDAALTAGGRILLNAGGAMLTAAAVNIAPGATVLNSGSTAGATMTLGGEIDNAGTISKNGLTFLNIQGPSFTNQPGGEVRVSLGTGVTISAPILTQQGLIVVSGLAAITVPNTPLINEGGGQITLNGGGLDCPDGFRNEADALVDGAGGFIDVSGGDIVNAGTILSLGDLTLDGNLTLMPGGVLDVRGDFVVTGTSDLPEFQNQGGFMQLSAGAGQSGLVEGRSLLVEDYGQLSVAGPVDLSLTGDLTIRALGSLGPSSATDSQISSANVVIGSPNGVGGELILDHDMQLTATDVSLEQSACVAPGARGCVPPVLQVKGRARLDIDRNLSVGRGTSIDVTSTLPVTLGGNFEITAIDPTGFDWTTGLLRLDGQTVQTVEAAGQDIGLTPDGLTDNFAIGSLEVASGADVWFVNERDNRTGGRGACDEALYVDVLTLRAGATVTLSDCRLYYRQLINQGATVTPLGCGRLARIVDLDIDADGDVDIDDMRTFIAVLLGADTDPGRRARSDLNGDGSANGGDIPAFMEAYAG